MRAMSLRPFRRRARLAVALALFGTLLAHGAASAPLPDLSGTWAAVEVYSGYLNTPLFGKLPGAITAGFRVEIAQTGTALALRARYCTLGVGSPLPFVTAEIPPALLAALRDVEQSATLKTSSAGVLFAQSWFSQVSGAHVSDADPLPATSDDPRVFDEDKDGHPGVTLRASLAEFLSTDLYLVIRLRYRLSGSVVSPDRIDGLIDWTGEIVVLGGSLPVLPSRPAAHPDPDPQKSWFVLVRVDPSCDCASLATTSTDLTNR